MEWLLILTLAGWAAGKAGGSAAYTAGRDAFKTRFAQLKTRRVEKLAAVRAGHHDGKPLKVWHLADRIAAFIHGVKPACKAFIHDAKTGWASGKERARRRWHRAPAPTPAPAVQAPTPPAAAPTPAPKPQGPANTTPNPDNVRPFKKPGTPQGEKVALGFNEDIVTKEDLERAMAVLQEEAAADLEEAAARQDRQKEVAELAERAAAAAARLGVDQATVGAIHGVSDTAQTGVKAAEGERNAAEQAHAQAGQVLTEVAKHDGIAEAIQAAPTAPADTAFYKPN